MDDLIERLERSVEVAPLERVDVDALQSRARRRARVRTVGGLALGVLVLVVTGLVIGPLLGTSVQIDDPVATVPGTDEPSVGPRRLPEGASFVARVADIGDITGIVVHDADGELSLQGTAVLIGRGMAPNELRYAVDHADTPAHVAGLWERFGITEGRPDDVDHQRNEKVVFVMVAGGCLSGIGFEVMDLDSDTMQLTSTPDYEATCPGVVVYETFALAVDLTKATLIPPVQTVVAPAGTNADRDHVIDFGVRGQDPDWPALEDLGNDQCLRQADEASIGVHLPVIDGTIVDVDLVAAPEGGDARHVRLQVVVHEWLRGDGANIVDVFTPQDRLGEPVYLGVRLLLAPGGNVDGHDLLPCGFSRLYTPELAAQWVEWIHGAP